MPGPDLSSNGQGRELHLLSIVAPMWDEEGVAEEFHRRVCAALDGLPFEIVVVDDGSTDGTGAVLERLAAADLRLKVVSLSRNFGHQTALTAGLDHARGDAVVAMDADLQDPPEVVLTLLERWRAGSDVVYAVRERRDGETRFKVNTAHWFYRMMARVSQLPIPEDAGDFRLFDRGALDALLAMRERNRYLRGMTVWVGFTQTAVPYRRDARYAGETKYTLRRMLRLSLDAVSSLSHVPLQAATLLGVIFALLAFVSIPIMVVARYAGISVPGISTVLVVVLLLGGIQLMAVGLIGEYVGRIYDEVKRRPLYVVRARRNFAERAPVQDAERERITVR